MMASSLWCLNALRWRKALSLFGPRTTRLSQTPHVWLLPMNGASKYHTVCVSRFPCNLLGPKPFLIPLSSPCPHMSSSPDQEPSSTVLLWTIWAPSPVWWPTLTASHPATHSQRRVSLPTLLASLLMSAWNLSRHHCCIKSTFVTRIKHSTSSGRNDFGKGVCNGQEFQHFAVVVVWQVSSVFWTSAMTTNSLVSVPPWWR